MSQINSNIPNINNVSGSVFYQPSNSGGATPYAFNLPANFPLHYQQQQAPNYSRPAGYQQYNNEDTVGKTAGAAVLLQAIALFLNKASKWCSYKLQMGREFASAEDIKEIAQGMKKNNKLDLNIEYVSETNKAALEKIYQAPKAFDAVAKGENAFFHEKLKLAVAPKSKPSLILHEVGHAITATKGKVLKFMQNSRMYAASVPTALLLLSSMAPKRQDGKQNFVERNAGFLGFAAFVPTIAEEALASHRGIKAAKEYAKKFPEKLIKIKPLKNNYALALMTYVIAGIGLGVAAKETILRDKMYRS